MTRIGVPAVFPLVADGDLVTRSGGLPARLHRATLAHEAAFARQLGRTRANSRRRSWVPIPAKPTPTYSNADNKYPLWLTEDGVTILGGNPILGHLYRSTDDWQTTETLYTFAAPPNSVRVLGNGELAVILGYPTDELWVSTGYPTLGAGATWTKRLTASGTNDLQAQWGIDSYGARVVVSEYGPKVPPTNPRFVYLSEDYGITWRTIFDLGPLADAHVHGVAYDRYRDWIWVCTGDGVNRSVRYSKLSENFATWYVVSQGDGTIQPVNMVPMPHCVLFGTDNPPNGIARLWIDTVAGQDRFDYDYPILADTEATLTSFSGQFFQRHPGAPVLMPFTRVTNGPAFLLATYDGVDFFELWRDTVSYANNQGLNFAVGPTASGKIVGINNDGRFAGRTILKMNAPTWQVRDTKFGGIVYETYGQGASGYAVARTVRNDVAQGGTLSGLDVRAKVRRATWTPAAKEDLASEYQGVNGNRSWIFELTSTAKLQLTWYPNGTSTGALQAQSVTALTAVLAPDRPYALRATLTFANGSNVWEANFYYSTDDGVTWLGLGAATTGAAPTNLFSAPDQPLIAGGEGAIGTLFVWTGEYHWLEVRNGVNGPVAAGIDFRGAQFQVGDALITLASGAPKTPYLDVAGNEWMLYANARVRAKRVATADPYVDRYVLPAAATDAATTQTLVNSIRQALIDAGWSS